MAGLHVIDILLAGLLRPTIDAGLHHQVEECGVHIALDDGRSGVPSQQLVTLRGADQRSVLPFFRIHRTDLGRDSSGAADRI